MLTRDTFDRQRAAVNQISRTEGRRLAALSVSLGVAQLVFLRWAEAALPGAVRRGWAAGLFIAYMGLVGVLVWRFRQHLRLAAPVCPYCGTHLEGASERLAAVTGRCDSCGGQVIAD